jgi:hypothetical protein
MGSGGPDPQQNLLTELRTTEQRVTAVLLKTAETYEHTAKLAQAIASRYEADGRDDDAAAERRVADRAIDLARLARSHSRQPPETPAPASRQRPPAGVSAWDELASERELIAEEREQIAAERERVGRERELVTEKREQAVKRRERASDALLRHLNSWEKAADVRERVANQREAIADERERTADERERLIDELAGIGEADERERTAQRMAREQAAAARQEAEIRRESAASARQTRQGRGSDGYEP